MTIIVTGAAGFIGGNIVKALNQHGITDIVAVDNLTRSEKFRNLAECEIAHYLDRHEFIRQVRGYLLPYENIEATFHRGAYSDIMNYDGLYMTDNNYQYMLDLLDWCQDGRIPFLHTSSATVYGRGEIFHEERELEEPLNVYSYSEFLFNQVLRRHIREGLTVQAVGFRYFNVYGQREQHKGCMASVAFHHFNQYHGHGYVNLSGANDGYGNGEQTRNFVSARDVAKVNLYFSDHPNLSGIYNLGTGHSRQFNELAAAAVNACRAAEGKEEMTLEGSVREELIRYIPFPGALKDEYQSFTQISIGKLREAGYQEEFLDVKGGVGNYVKWMLENLI